MSASSIEFTLELFNASETERVTGVSKVNQRNWRHKGLLGKIEGHARHDIFSLAEIYVYQTLSDRGIPAKDAVRYIGTVAEIVAFKALEKPRSYHGPFSEINSDAWSQYSRNSKDKELLDGLKRSHLGDSLEKTACAIFLRKEAVRFFGWQEHTETKFALIGSYDHFILTSTNADADSKLPSLESEILRLSLSNDSSAYIVLDLSAVGKRLAELTFKPFINFCVPAS